MQWLYFVIPLFKFLVCCLAVRALCNQIVIAVSYNNSYLVVIGLAFLEASCLVGAVCCSFLLGIAGRFLC